MQECSLPRRISKSTLRVTSRRVLNVGLHENEDEERKGLKKRERFEGCGTHTWSGHYAKHLEFFLCVYRQRVSFISASLLRIKLWSRVKGF